MFTVLDDSTDMQTEDMLEDNLFKILSAAEKEKQQEISKRVEDILDDLTELAGEEDALDLRAAGDAETSTVTEEEEDTTGEVADDGLIIKKGCGDHQEGEKWGTPEHDNCLCAGPDSFCDHVDCPSGSEITRDSNGLWECPGGSSTDDSDEKQAQVDMLEDRLIQILEEEDALDLRVADGVETLTVRGAEENATVDKGQDGIDSRGLADGRLIKKGTGGGSYRADFRCGSRYPAGNGYAAACNANGPSPCCSRWDWCGSSAAHCNCATCVDYRKRDFRNDFRCGQGFPAGNGRPAKCNRSGPSPCCSRWKWCGSSSLHCNCHGCVDYRKYGL
ncbi:Hypp9274 [Branchiostoma lanceolatum]|uniref:Hypp9274 protein n=1 Tax=Branchiostoma lanceolatum TaxID=7740 RepID=A0A8J9ZDG2_BRALA|nr:Hypp9274 [Branchiostoma lanceolatum]